MAQPVYHNYILLPKPGARSQEKSGVSETQATFARLTTNTRLDDVLDGNLTDRAVVLDTIDQNGAKLIRLPESELADLRAQLPGVRIVPEVFYYPQRWQVQVRTKPQPLAGQAKVVLKVSLREAKTTKPVVGAVVVAFTNFEQREGEQATSDA